MKLQNVTSLIPRQLIHRTKKESAAQNLNFLIYDHLATSIYATSLILKNTVIDILLLFKGYV